ncbi:hypothetical protein [Streptomyces sp. 4R-3d]|uniref:hypothetical protein n=1 Tax=Streptomyces sp. 4R-3d TaxID=2559605 RepID=UPI001071F2B7|nr:hypothetical protein [Streptomyces sp. 4R-3d]TFI24988.1 hypothetical protein E4P36_20805 [Streptomyces sp. 4R-3d]
MNRAAAGLIAGIALGFAGYFGGFGAFVVVAVLGIVGFVAGRYADGDMGSGYFFRRPRRDDDMRRRDRYGRPR